MVFSANYAMSRYGGLAYGVRGAAGYIGSTSDGVTGGDSLGVSNRIAFIFSENAAGSDVSAITTGFSVLYDEHIAGLDDILFSLFSPLNVFALLQEKRNASLLTEARAGTLPARMPGQVVFASRQAVTKTDNRNTTAKSDSREFEA